MLVLFAERSDVRKSLLPLVIGETKVIERDRMSSKEREKAVER